MKLIKIVHELRAAKGTNAKLKILESHKDNGLWIEFLKYTYDARISYGVSAPTTTDFECKRIDNHMFDDFDSLADRRITGRSARHLVKALSTEYGEIPRLVLARSIKAGISVKTINKVYTDLIPVFETMKGIDIPFEEFPLVTSIKFDGVKVFVVSTSDGTKLLTSSGAEFECNDLKLEFSMCTFGIYECEFIYKEGKIKHRPTITGKLNSLLSGSKVDLSDCSLQIYDFVPFDEWRSRSGKLTFKERQDILTTQFSLGFKDSEYIKKVDHYLIGSEEEHNKMYEKLIEMGYEGTMNRYEEDVYEWTGDKRTKRLIKKKSIRECTLLCIGTIPHSNPGKGITGSLILEGVLKDKNAGEVFVKVSTGSGLSKFDVQCDADRYTDHYVEVRYNSVTTTEKGHSLFLPRFKRIVK